MEYLIAKVNVSTQMVLPIKVIGEIINLMDWVTNDMKMGLRLEETLFQA